jgi:hypothetical protein
MEASPQAGAAAKPNRAGSRSVATAIERLIIDGKKLGTGDIRYSGRWKRRIEPAV